MDDTIGFILFWVAVIFIGGPIWVIVNLVRSRRRIRALEEKAQVDAERAARFERTFTQLGDLAKTLTSRIEALESGAPVAKPQPVAAPPPKPAEMPKPVEVPQPAAARPIAPVIAPAPVAIPLPTPVPPAVERPAAMSAATTVPPPPQMTRPTPPAPLRPARPPIPPKPVVPPLPLPVRLPAPVPTVGDYSKKPRRSMMDMEEALGTNWLNKLGVIILVLGVAFFGIYEAASLGPLGKVIVMWFASLAVLAGGVWLERKERYQMFARAGIGGGWSLLFFTTYAMHHVPAMRVLESQVGSLVLMLIVATVMVVHTLKYKSQTVTGLAFLLAFTTVTVSHVTAYSMVASGILAAGLVAIVLRMRWYELEVFGIVASYLNHYFWLRPIIEPMGDHHVMFPQYKGSLALLVLYWAVYRVSYVLRRATSAAEESTSTVAALLNTIGLLALMKYQSVRPELAFYALLVLGALEFACGLLPMTRARRTAFLTLVTMGTALMTAAVPFRYTGSPVAIFWLIGAEVLFLAGIFAAESAFRRLAMAVMLLVGGHLLLIETGALSDWVQPAVGIVPHWGLFLTVAAVLYLNAHFFGLRRQELFEELIDHTAINVISYMAATLAVFGLWYAFPGAGAAVAWALLMFVLAGVGLKFDITRLSEQSVLLALLVIGRTVFVNLQIDTLWWRWISVRLATTSAVCAMLYGSAKWLGWGEEEEIRERVRTFFLWAATALVAVLIAYELPTEWWGVGWITQALVLNTWARGFRIRRLPAQAHVVGGIAAIFTLAINFAPETHIRIATITSAVVGTVLYVLALWAEVPESMSHLRIRQLHSWAASITAALVMWHALKPLSVAVAWGAFGLLLFLLGQQFKWSSVRFQAYTALTAAFTRIFVVNFNAAATGDRISPAVYTVVPLVLMFYFVHQQVERFRADFSARETDWQISGLLAYLGTAALAGLALFESAPDAVAPVWAGMVVVLLAVAMLLKRRVFQHQAMLLSLAVLFRALTHNMFGSSYFTGRGMSTPLLMLIITVALLLGSLPFAFRLREKSTGGGVMAAIIGHPEQLLFFIPIGLITVMLALKMPSGMLTLAWGIEGLVVFLFALAVGERSFRLTGLALLLLCVAKITFIDLWELSLRDKFLTLIALGTSLVVVSFLYNRYRETLRRYL